MKKSQETIGTDKPLVSFGEAIKALKEGKRVKREGWNHKDLFVFMQVPSQVPIDIVPKMTSLPKSVKDALLRRKQSSDCIDHLAIKYHNQMALVYPNNNISGWSPSGSDALADDWIVLD